MNHVQCTSHNVCHPPILCYFFQAGCTMQILTHFSSPIPATFPKLQLVIRANHQAPLYAAIRQLVVSHCDIYIYIYIYIYEISPVLIFSGEFHNVNDNSYHSCGRHFLSYVRIAQTRAKRRFNPLCTLRWSSLCPTGNTREVVIRYSQRVCQG
jgi:hypothetical protein